MKNIWKLVAAIAMIGGLAACSKNKGPIVDDGPTVPTDLTDFSGGCEAVDLGLSVKWATYNVGAANPDENGHHFAWGETKPKEKYMWLESGDYKWGVYNRDASPKYGMTKYTASAKRGDKLKTLLPEDDAATANWGTKWRMPTIKEFDELLDETKCEWTRDATNGGYTVRSLANGNSIFLPAEGYRINRDLIGAGKFGLYWTSSLDDSRPDEAYYYYDNARSSIFRYCGYSVRAVTEY